MQDTLVPVAMIAAVSRNRVIGVEGKLPWYLPEDLKFFKAVTLHKPLIMGRATFASIGRALPNRLNIVVTRDTTFEHPGVRVCHDLENALALADDQAMIEGVEEIMVIGGGEIYQQMLPCAARLYLTEIDAEVAGDTLFPELTDDWQEVERVAGAPKEGQPGYDFVRYEKAGAAEG
ncbi:dihydrofolate reductase [Kushneria avicenniae]|uniref:Dihydrofolate reductase n=1 Tax=Kushneria avicenniae TaxID=402385 RepID=A0A1I1IJU8_9GAMM|nr:dihydrofolate reductase [Kushneria avicenniae]SFC33490.1 dihydrofolate reductase [Kushneria avicenniae]